MRKVDQGTVYSEHLRQLDSARGFSRRVFERRLAWWEYSLAPSNWRNYPKILHQIKENHTYHHSSDSEKNWRCCDFWQRKLLNKWNSREFVQRFGVPVPKLYWHGRRVHSLPFKRLPDSFVIRPVWGASRRGVHVVIEGTKFIGKGTARHDHLLRQLIAERGRFNIDPLLCEEAIRPARGAPQLPLEIKCHMFSGKVGAIQMVDRNLDRRTVTSRYYQEDWRPFRHRMSSLPQLPLQDPPPYLDGLVKWARQMGSAIGTYMRIDFFGTGKTCAFNEFSSTPGVRQITPFHDEVFESLWQAHLPSQT